MYIYIENLSHFNKALPELSHLAHKEGWIGVDTEFYRVHTYWPVLSLIQISAGEKMFLFDVISLGDAVLQLSNVLCDTNILKIFHSAEQDIGILNKLFKKEVKPIFDTQIAAKLCGLGRQIGYANLVENVLNITLSKQEQFSEWLLRPLREEQLFYAAVDVLHLGALYKEMKNIEPDSLQESHFFLEGLVLNKIQGSALLKKIKRKPSSKAALCLLEKLVILREEIAQKDNIPRQKVMPDRFLIDLVHRAFKTELDLEKIPGFRPHIKRKWGETISKLLIEERHKIVQEHLSNEEDPKSIIYLEIPETSH